MITLARMDLRCDGGNGVVELFNGGGGQASLCTPLSSSLYYFGELGAQALSAQIG